MLFRSEVQGTVCALAVYSACGAEVLGHQHLLLDVTAEHVSLHADVEDVASSSEGQAKLLLTTEGEALVPEKVQEMRKSWVVLQKYKYRDSKINGWYMRVGKGSGPFIFLCKVHKCCVKPSHIEVYLLDQGLIGCIGCLED